MGVHARNVPLNTVKFRGERERRLRTCLKSGDTCINGRDMAGPWLRTILAVTVASLQILHRQGQRLRQGQLGRSLTFVAATPSWCGSNPMECRYSLSFSSATLLTLVEVMKMSECSLLRFFVTRRDDIISTSTSVMQRYDVIINEEFDHPNARDQK